MTQRRPLSRPSSVYRISESRRVLEIINAPVAQLDRAADYGSAGWGFDSLRAYLSTSQLPTPAPTFFTPRPSPASSTTAKSSTASAARSCTDSTPAFAYSSPPTACGSSGSRLDRSEKLRIEVWSLGSGNSQPRGRIPLPNLSKKSDALSAVREQEIRRAHAVRVSLA